MGGVTQRSKTVLHIDMNSYFATLLQQENPHLRGKPVGVLKDVGRTCLIAASKEAKRYGVKTGWLLRDAKKVCPDIICVPASFRRYLDATKRLEQIFHSLSPDVYIYSLDEAFVDVTECLHYLYPDALSVARIVRQKIFRELGSWVTCSIGIAQNRFLAKMASETTAADSILAITEHNRDSILASTPFDQVCGIGLRLSKKLHTLGITVPYQIRFYTEEDLVKVVGPFWAKELLTMAYGEEPHLLRQIDRPATRMKSVGRSITGYRLYNDVEETKVILMNLIEEVMHKVRVMGLAGRYVWVKLYGSPRSQQIINDGGAGHDRSWKAHQTTKYPICDERQMFEIISQLLTSFWRRRFPIIKFAVRLGLLEVAPLPLLAEDQRRARVASAIDSMNAKYGLFTVRSGRLLKHDLIKPEVTGFLGDRLYQLQHAV